MNKKFKSIIKGFALLSIVGFLSSCGGGGGGSSSTTTTPTTPTSTISGTAASGAPLVGIVNVLGANGSSASSLIESDGSYSIDVTLLTPPFILFAEGSVNGRSISMYSASVAAGIVNITPITDFILRNALAGTAEAAYTGWASSQVSAAALSAAETNAQQQLQPVLSALGIAGDVDLMSTPFSADLTGIDMALEALEITYIGSVATVTNNLAGSGFTDDFTTPADDSNALPAADLTATTATLSDQAAINSVFQILEDLFTTSVPSAPELNTFAVFMADDFIEFGRTKSQTLDEWIGDDGLPTGFILEAVIDRVMDVSATIYSKGYWIKLKFTHNGESETVTSGMVYDGVNWLWFGDQLWADIFISPHAFYADFIGTFGTGFELGIDDDFNYAYDQGVRSALVTGPGLPVDGVLLAHQFPETFIGLYTTGDSFYEITDDAIIAAIPDNAEYTYTLCSETADALNTNGHNTCTVLQTYTTITMKPPLPKSALNASMFPALTSPNSHDLSVLNFGGLINVSISTPVGMSLGGEVALCWQLISGDDYCSGAEIENATATLDTIGLPAPDTGWASIFVRAGDIYGRDFNRHWFFSNF